MKINIEYKDEEEKQKVFGFYRNTFREDKSDEVIESYIKNQVTASIRAKLSPGIVRAKQKEKTLQGGNLATAVKEELAGLFKED